MRKVIVAINITLDGFCDHTVGIVDEELHMHFSKIMEKVDVSLMGRVTYQLMEDYWPAVAKNKTGTKAEVRFAEEIDRIHKIVVSKTLNEVNWEGVEIIRDGIVEKVRKLKKEEGNDILIGGPSLISYLSQHKEIDEYNFVIHPFILGKGIPLFKNLTNQINLEFIKANPFESGVISTHYRVKR